MGRFMYGATFEPVCEETEACKVAKQPGHQQANACRCSGDWNDRVEILDKVHIPAGTPPGDYVLGWRWDCEESTQVWTSCSDVTITAA